MAGCSQARFTGQIEVSFEIPVAPRTIKDREEMAISQRRVRGAEMALAAGAALIAPGRSEAEVARAIVSRSSSGSATGRRGDGRLRGAAEQPLNAPPRRFRDGCPRAGQCASVLLGGWTVTGCC